METVISNQPKNKVVFEKNVLTIVDKDKGWGRNKNIEFKQYKAKCFKYGTEMHIFFIGQKMINYKYPSFKICHADKCLKCGKKPCICGNL